MCGRRAPATRHGADAIESKIERNLFACNLVDLGIHDMARGPAELSLEGVQTAIG
jgi:hypothetical protein